MLPIIIVVVLIAGGIYLARRFRSREGYSAIETATEVNDPSASRQVSALMNRYRDAYRIARVTNGFGGTIKTMGILVGAVLVVIGYYLANSSIFGIVGIVPGIIVGSFFYIIGVLVSAQGQILKANLDNAVNSSPFLTNEHREKICPCLLAKVGGKRLCRDGCEAEDAGVAGGEFYVTAAEGVSDIIEFVGIVHGQIRRPVITTIHQFHIDFGGIVSFINHLRTNSLAHFLLPIKSSSHNSGSGRYAVTRTAGPVWPFGIPQTT